MAGYKIPFVRSPRKWRTRPTVANARQRTELMTEAIQSLISKGAIKLVDPHPQQFISTLFLVEKGQGTGVLRPVINLKALNRFLPKEKFKMEGLHTGSLSAPQGRLHDEARSARRLFCSSYSSGLQEVPLLPVRENNFRCHSASRWPLGFSPELCQLS